MNEIYKDIQGILAVSDIHPADCIKINNLIVELIKENQELKKQLHEASLTIQEMAEQDIECPSNCEKLRQLKKQLENYKKLGFKYLQDKNNNLEKQQKEFINCLEDEYTKIQSEIEKETNNNAKYFKIERRQTITGILQKYKEIIGDDK